MGVITIPDKYRVVDLVTKIHIVSDDDTFTDCGVWMFGRREWLSQDQPEYFICGRCLKIVKKYIREQPRFKVGDRVDYFKRGVCYPGIIREDLGIIKGAGRRYRITPPDGEHDLEYFVFDVAERWLDKPL